MSLLEEFGYYDRYDRSVPDEDEEGSEGFHEPEEVEVEEEIQFKLDDLRFDKTLRHGGIQQVVAANDVLLIASQQGRFFFFDLQSQDTTMFDVPRKGDEETHRVFLDPSGQHALIFMTNGDGHFFQASAAKPKKLDKIRGKERGSDKLVNIVVNSVGFDRRLKNYGVGTGSVGGSGAPSSSAASFSVGILLGSDDGRIFEAKMTPDGLKSVHQVYDFHERVKDESPITGIQFELFGEEPGAIRQMHIMIATPNRLYRLIGGPSFEEVFAGYMQPPPFNELPLALKDAPLHFFARSTTQLPLRFGWMTTAGIYHGNLKYSSMATVPADAVTVDVDLLPYERDRPASFLLSEFHFFVLFPDRLQIYLHPSGKIPREDRDSKNRKLVFEVVFEKETQTGTPIGLAHDVTLNTYWLYTDRKIFEIVVQDETRDLWKLFLDRAKKFPEYFNLALQYCMDNTEHEDRVLSEKAEYFFRERDYVRSARVFATTSRPFEEIALRFVKTQDKVALRTFLLEKLRSYRPQDAMQRNCLCTWLTEIYLNHIDDVSKTGDEDAKQVISQEFEDFLTEYKVDLNTEATFRLISSHGLVRHMVFYAHLIQDFEKVVSHYVTRKDWESALSVLETKCRAPDYAELFYKFTPVLLDAEPERTVRVLLSVHNVINPVMLLPAILQGPVEDGIRFLYYFIFVDRCEDEAVHNGLLNLYVKANDDAKLHSFLTYQDAKYDKRYALNLCLGSNKVNACVYLYGAMGLFEEAVDIALRNGNVKLARVSADRVEGDDERRKQLWMSIARHVVEHQKEKGIKEVMELIRECSLIRIEDVLPFFPDFWVIDDFKDEICKSLEEYSSEIADLNEEMEKATGNADLIRQDIRGVRDRFGHVSMNQKCALTGEQLHGRPFYLFPCGHAVLDQPLIDEVLRGGSRAVRAKIMKVRSQLARPESIRAEIQIPKDSLESADSFYEEAVRKLRRRLDEYVAAECPLCGDLMIRSIDEPLVSLHETAVQESWRV